MDFVSTLLFYGVFSLFVAIGLPFTRRVFSCRVVAYAVAKLAGLIVFGYVIWRLSSFRFLDYQSRGYITLIFGGAVLVGMYVCRDFFRSVNKSKRRLSWRNILIIESISLGTYLAYLFVRSHQPAIDGTERFMDMALLSASGKTNFFPFIDPWYAGHSVNYYYYGSYLMSLLSNLSQIPYALSYNLALGLIFSQSFLLAGALAFVFTRSWKSVVLASVLVTMAGTLFFAWHSCAAGLSGAYSYAASTRLYSPSYIINEIPSYSFTVGDLHAHLLALPFFLFNLIILFAFFKSKGFQLSFFGLLSLGLATSALISTWDAITLGVVLFVVTGIKGWFAWSEPNEGVARERLIGVIIGILFLVLLGGVLVSPFFWQYESPVLGVGFSPFFIVAHQLKNVQWPTPLSAIIGMWGVFLIGISMSLRLLWKREKEHLFLGVLYFVAVGILIGIEALFIKDIYSVTNPPYFRANTVFKFGFHAWVLFSIIFSVCMTKLLEEGRKPGRRSIRILARSLIGTVVIGGLVYPYQALTQFYSLGRNSPSLTLDGSAWMKQASRDDWEVVGYINEHLHDRTVVAEAVGESYSRYGRIAAFTGMIAPLGWKTHEWTWRFRGESTDTGWNVIAQVVGDMEQLYVTKDDKEAQRIIQRYQIQYVYVGDMERSAYPKLQEEKFSRLGRVVFESGNSRLFVVKEE